MEINNNINNINIITTKYELYKYYKATAHNHPLKLWIMDGVVIIVNA